MADITVNIAVSNVQYATWLRTSYIASAEVSDKGVPMIEQFELGPDQEDAFKNYMDEATREVAKLFSSRQGDAEGVPFEYDGTNVIYRFKEGTPALAQTTTLKSQLDEDVKNALFSYLSILWYTAKNKDIASYYQAKFYNHSNTIEKNLYLLHD